MGFVGVPLMALAISPVQAAAILLPILVMMDLVSLWTWRGVFDRNLLRSMMPGAMIGIGAGWLMASLVTADMVRLIVGVVAFVFVLRWLYQQIRHGAAMSHTAQPGARAPSGARSPASPASSPMSAARPSRSTPCRSARSEGLDRHQRHLLCRHQCGEAHSLFRTWPVRHDKPHRLGGADADRAAGDARRRLWLVRRMRPRGVLSVHLCDGGADCRQARVRWRCSPACHVTIRSALPLGIEPSEIRRIAVPRRLP